MSDIRLGALGSLRTTAILFLTGTMALTALLQFVDQLHLSYTFLYRPRALTINFVEWPSWSAASLLLAVLLLVPDPRKAIAGSRHGVLLLLAAIIGPVMVLTRSAPLAWAVLIFSAIVSAITVARPIESIGCSRKEVLSFWTVTWSLLLLIMEAAAVFVWAEYPLYSSFPLTGSSLWEWPETALGVFYIAYGIAPYLVLLLLSGWIWTPIMDRVRRSRPSDARIDLQLPPWIRKRSTLYSLLALLAMSVLLGVYAIAATKIPIGADARKFLPFLRVSIDSSYVNSLLSWNARGGYILFLYGLKEASGLGPEAAFNIQPIVYAFLLSAGVFLLARSSTGDLGLALLSGLFTIFSSQTIVAMLYAAYPNWLAMVGLVAFLYFAIKSEMRRKWRYAVLAQLAVAAMLVTHYWTWAAGMAILAVYAMVRAIRGLRGPGRTIFGLRFPVAILAVNVLLAYYFLPIAYGSDITLRQVFTGSARHYPELWATNLAEVASTVAYFLAHPRVGQMLPTIVYSLTQVGATFFNQSWLFLLAAYGLYRLYKRRDRLGDLMMAWTFFSFLATLLIDPFLQWRIMFIFPFGILLAAGSVGVAGSVGRLAGPFRKTCSLSALSALLLVEVNYALAATAHLFLLIPGLAGS